MNIDEASEQIYLWEPLGDMTVQSPSKSSPLIEEVLTQARAFHQFHLLIDWGKI